MEEARRYVVRGRVQGVGFRFFVEREARQLGLSGYVKNLRNGNVEVLGIGPSLRLEELKRRLEFGPRSARVETVSEETVAPDERYRGDFVIEFEGGGW